MEQEIRFDPTTDDVLLDLTPIEQTIVEYRVAEEVASPRHGLVDAALWQLAVKRFMDIVASALALVVLTPLLLAVALLVRRPPPAVRSSTCRNGWVAQASRSGW